MSVQLLSLATTNFVDTGRDAGRCSLSADKRAWHVVRDAMRGHSLLPEYADCIGAERSRAFLCSEFRLCPFEDDPLSYDVRYEFALAVESSQQAQQARRLPQPFLQEERLTYVERRGSEVKRRKKAFDTVGLSHYKGIHPEDVMFAMGRNRWEIAEISALRLLAERLGRSFFFFDEFRPLAQRTARIRPGAYFLRALHAFAVDGESTALENLSDSAME